MTFLNNRRFLLITGTCILLITALSITTILLGNNNKAKDTVSTTSSTSVTSEIKAPPVVNVPEPEVAEYKFDASKFRAFPKKSSRTLTSAEEEELNSTGEESEATDEGTVDDPPHLATTEVVNEHLNASESDKEDKFDSEKNSDIDTPLKQQLSPADVQEYGDVLGFGLVVDMTSASESEVEKEKETKADEQVEPSPTTLTVSESNKKRISYGFGRHTRTFGEILVSGLPGNHGKKILFSAVKDEPINLFIEALKKFAGEGSKTEAQLEDFLTAKLGPMQVSSNSSNVQCSYSQCKNPKDESIMNLSPEIGGEIKIQGFFEYFKQIRLINADYLYGKDFYVVLSGDCKELEEYKSGVEQKKQRSNSWSIF